MYDLLFPLSRPIPLGVDVDIGWSAPLLGTPSSRMEHLETKSGEYLKLFSFSSTLLYMGILIMRHQH